MRLANKTRKSLISKYKEITNAIENNLKHIGDKKQLYFGMDEGGIVGSPTIVIAEKKEFIPKGIDFIGKMPFHYIKKYMINLFFIWAATGVSYGVADIAYIKEPQAPVV